MGGCDKRRETISLKRIVVALSGILVLLVAVMAMPSVYAQVTRSVTGSGSGTAECSGGTFPGSIIFSASSSQGKTSGTWVKSNTISGTTIADEFGTITGGHINSHNYRLDGMRTRSFCGTSVGIPITISGDCGTGVTITYEIGRIVAGTFTGDVSCITS